MKDTIDEIVHHIIKHGGPDLERKAHPKKKRVRYEDLREAVYKIHTKGSLLNLKEYQFNNVFGIWNKDGKPNKQLGREFFDELMEKLLQKYETLTNVVDNFSKDEILNERLKLKTKDGIIEYGLESMFQNVSFDGKHKGSPYSILKYWIDTHHQERIRKEYSGIKPWHLNRVSRDIWVGEEGKKNGRELTDELIKVLTKRHGNSRNALRKITAEHFEKEQLEYVTSDGVIVYTPNSMFQRVKYDRKQIKSLYAAINYWMNTHNDKTIKERYAPELEIIKERAGKNGPN
jgi:polyhydroxyalkanoate synthesis regulator phasin